MRRLRTCVDADGNSSPRIPLAVWAVCDAHEEVNAGDGRGKRARRFVVPVAVVQRDAVKDNLRGRADVVLI